MVNAKITCGCGVLFSLLLASTPAFSQREKNDSTASAKPIPAGAKIYIAPFQDGFETYFTAGILKKKVPVVLVNDRSKADYEITGSVSMHGGFWRGYGLGADVRIVDLKSGQAVLEYYRGTRVANASRGTSASGRQTLGEYCAGYLKKQIRTQK